MTIPTQQPQTASPGRTGRMPSPGALPSLTGLRFYAALAVFLVHVTTPQMGLFSGEAGQDVSRLFSVAGGLGVSFFFILSGFILTWSARPSDTPGLFMRRRLVKLYPNHLVTFVLAMVVFASAPTWKQWLPNLLLLQTWTWDPTVVFSGNQPSWSLCCELLFYLCFPMLYRAVKTIPPARLWGWAVALLAAIVAIPAIAYAMMPGEITVPGWHASEIQNWFVYNLPPVRMLEFVLGMLLARIVLTDRWIGMRLWQAVLLCVLAYGVALKLPYLYALCAVWAAPIGLLIATAAVADTHGQRSPFRGPVMKWLGEVSFAFYLLQASVLLGGTSFLREHAPYTFAEAVGLSLLFWIITTGLAFLLYMLVERPAMKHLSRPRRKNTGTGPTRLHESTR